MVTIVVGEPAMKQVEEVVIPSELASNDGMKRAAGSG